MAAVSQGLKTDLLGANPRQRACAESLT
ncbi:RNA polymerase subunit sigma, partial [Mesorhizobium sp. M7A.F.Ca.CA.003.01.2.1]